MFSIAIAKVVSHCTHIGTCLCDVKLSLQTANELISSII